MTSTWCSYSISVVLSCPVPNTAPKDLQGHRINDTHMNFTWEPLTLVEARGIVQSYTVLYTPTGRSRGLLTVSADTEYNYVTIEDLDPSKGYTVQVWANTSAGAGESSTISFKALSSSDSEYSNNHDWRWINMSFVDSFRW